MLAHVDADSFFASVLQRGNPRLKGKPLLAVGMGGAIVIAATYEAKALGVKTGMRLVEARRLCPKAIEMTADFRETGMASAQIEEIIREHCPVIEQMSVDEWFLDLATCIGGVPRDLGAWTLALRQDILRRTDLSVSIGVAPTKLLAKMAGEYRKPGGVTVISLTPPPPPPEGEGDRRGEGKNGITIEHLLRDRPAAAIPGIGRRTEPKVAAQGWRTAWDIATADTEALAALLGKTGRDMQRALLGTATDAVVAEPAAPKSVSRARSFRASRDRAMLWGYALQHLQYLVLKMRREGLQCKGMTLWLRDGQYAHRGESVSLPRAMDTEELLTPFLRRCFAAVHAKTQPYTQVGVALWNLTPHGPSQASLFEEPDQATKRERLQETLDVIRTRFGRNAIHRGSALSIGTGTKKDLGWSVYV
ncbi:MAG: DNA polymerase IV [Candidatus Peregrinibacteria bacterium Gr01-1014_25]|nr:MAG: DNA polymerase IV [Candidatus Peregrinibacteria bacterium Gr01-1014_25]